MAERLLRVGLVGCGAISRKYLATLADLPGVKLVACADAKPERADAVCEKWPGIRPLPVGDLIAVPDVDLVLNLTPPAAHADIADEAIRAGKHVYGEKPLATTVADGAALLRCAEVASRQVGCAPDTVLGTGIQTARTVIDRGDIGTPRQAAAFLTSAGPDNHHPNPRFFYQPGGGPLMDMGPYYITALITLLGPVRRVTGFAASPRRRREVTSGNNAGMVIEVAVDTDVSAVLEHHNGALSTLVTSWDVPAGSSLPRIEVYGDAGTLHVPDPNQFAGTVQIRATRTDVWTSLAPLAGYRDVERGIGIADLAHGLTTGRAPRASGELALHTLEVMASILDAAHTSRAVLLSTSCQVPPPVPLTDPHAAGSDR